MFFISFLLLTTPELKQNNKEKIKDINASNFFLPLTWTEIFVPEQLKILLNSCQHNQNQLNIYLIYLLTIVNILFLDRNNL